ncbi:MAG: PA2778 family cysteine peptidase [Candidatus Thiodiazotropha sp. (ex Epidulcina cf. delphinae)]|nr:PA2778 family cysteine peptidase [Candidatus Thiodiazotropha sp. (ex Epidulcina cf. delphinae)]
MTEVFCRRLARISHTLSIAAAQWRALSGFYAVGVLDSVSTMPARPSAATNPPGADLDSFAGPKGGGQDARHKAAHHAPSTRLAAIGCEKCRLAVLVLLVLAGCASHRPVLLPSLSGEAVAPELELQATPFYPQRQYQCGPAALATVLDQSGISVTPDELVPLVYLPEREGSLQVEMIAASRRFNRIPYVITPDLHALMAELQAGRSVLVLQNLGLRRFPLWHYAVVIGYSVERDEVLLRSGVTRRKVLSAQRFLDTWGAGGRWALVLLKPGELPERPERLTYLKAVAAMEQVASPQTLIEAYQAGLNRWPGDQLALFGMAAALHRKNDLAAAESAYRRLLAGQPGHTAARNNLAEVLADRGCFTEAMANIDQALEGDNGNLRQALIETRRGIQKRKKQTSTSLATCERSIYPQH